MRLLVLLLILLPLILLRIMLALKKPEAFLLSSSAIDYIFRDVIKLSEPFK